MSPIKKHLGLASHFIGLRMTYFLAPTPFIFWQAEHQALLTPESVEVDRQKNNPSTLKAGTYLNGHSHPESSLLCYQCVLPTCFSIL